MTPHRIVNNGVVSDDDEEEDFARATHKKEKILAPCNKLQVFSTKWREKLRWLTRVGTRGNTRPEVGQMCLSVVGKSGDDHGQIGIITNRAPSMVAVTMLGSSGTDTVTKLKRPSSLILLETGLTVMQDSDGSVWIRRCVYE
jgi:hypothetical protein